MRILCAGVAIALVAACGGKKETTPAGPVGTPIDLRSRITNPEAAAHAPTDDKATPHDFALDVHGIKAKVVWRTFEDRGTRYIISAGWEVVTPATGVTLESLGVLNPENAGSTAAPVQAEIIRARWHEGKSSLGDVSVKIDAAGNASKI